MKMDSNLADALLALFTIGNELFVFQSLAERESLVDGHARAILGNLRRQVAKINAALDGIDRQIDALKREARTPKPAPRATA